jgi:hypothetical protein
LQRKRLGGCGTLEHRGLHRIGIEITFKNVHKAVTKR